MQKRAATDPTSWSFQAAIHGTHVTPAKAAWNQCRHGTWNFVSWHRAFLYCFERIVRAEVVKNGGAADWALPYWRYGIAGQAALPVAFRNPTRPDGSANPLFVAGRNPGVAAGHPLPPSVTTSAFALRRPSFTGTTEFGGGVTSWIGQFYGQTGALESTPHNVVHDAIGGKMSDPDAAAADPIFWLHHANIDRLWWTWEQHHTNPTDPSWLNHGFSFFDEHGARVTLSAAGVVDIEEQLGYTYDAPVAPPIPPRPAPHPWPRPWPWPDLPHGLTGEDVAHMESTPPPVRSILGASASTTRLVGQAATVPVTIDQTTAESLLADTTAAPSGPPRAYLDVEDIDAKANPGVPNGVYVNLPASPTEADLETHHVGNISLFGVERAREPRGPEPPHALRASFDISPVLDRLAADGSWTKGDQLDVTFRPLLEDPGSHADNPITIGRVSIHYS